MAANLFEMQTSTESDTIEVRIRLPKSAVQDLHPSLDAFDQAEVQDCLKEGQPAHVVLVALEIIFRRLHEAEVALAAPDPPGHGPALTRVWVDAPVDRIAFPTLPTFAAATGGPLTRSPLYDMLVALVAGEVALHDPSQPVIRSVRLSEEQYRTTATYYPMISHEQYWADRTAEQPPHQSPDPRRTGRRPGSQSTSTQAGRAAPVRSGTPIDSDGEP